MGLLDGGRMESLRRAAGGELVEMKKRKRKCEREREEKQGRE